MGEGITLGALAAFFLPEVFQMKEAIPILSFIIFVLIGVLFIVIGGIMSTRVRTR